MQLVSLLSGLQFLKFSRFSAVMEYTKLSLVSVPIISMSTLWCTSFNIFKVISMMGDVIREKLLGNYITKIIRLRCDYMIVDRA